MKEGCELLFVKCIMHRHVSDNLYLLACLNTSKILKKRSVY